MRLWAMTSRVMSIWALVTASFMGSATKSLRVPKARECRSTRSWPSASRPRRMRSISVATSARFSSSAALTLKKWASRPPARISPTMRSTLGRVARRSRCTPNTLRPARASAKLVASPKPEDAPRTKAQPDSRTGSTVGEAISAAILTPRAAVLPLGAMAKTAGIVLIGNEILSGKIADANAAYLCRELRALGVEVRRISIIPDVVFTSGGVGPTHDDVTMEGVARAVGTRVIRHPSLVALLERYYQGPLNEARLRLAEVPEGAELVADGSLMFPAVTVRNVYILPGVPEIFRQKFDALRERFRETPFHLISVFVNIGEGTLADHLNTLVARHPDLLLGSYPEFSNPEYKVKVTFESKDRTLVERAVEELLTALPPGALVRVQR